MNGFSKLEDITYIENNDLFNKEKNEFIEYSIKRTKHIIRDRFVLKDKDKILLSAVKHIGYFYIYTGRGDLICKLKYWDFGRKFKCLLINSGQESNELLYLKYFKGILYTEGFYDFELIIHKDNGLTNIITKQIKHLIFFQKKNYSQFHYLINKYPKYNNIDSSYTLKFKSDKIVISSVKNFIIENNNESILEFGRGKNEFSMSYKTPLSMVEAFTICLTTFVT